MIKIKGQIQSGMGCAKNMLQLQNSFLKRYIPDIDDFHNGTINILLERPLIIFKPEILTSDFTYEDGQKERFGLQKINLEVNNAKHEAWIYIPFRSPHRSNPFLVEIIGKYIEHNSLDYCYIEIDIEARETMATVIE